VADRVKANSPRRGTEIANPLSVRLERTVMTPTLVAVSLMLLVETLPNARVHASETCVKDARAALEADSPRAFGPEAIVEGPKTIEAIEREVGRPYPEWEELKRLVLPGDCLMFFRSNPLSWKHA
jgi:hypothetical protein